MSKKITFAFAASLLVIASGTSTAFAATDSDGTATTSTTVVAPPVDRTFFVARREAIRAAFQVAMNSARDAFIVARKSATTDEERRSAEIAFQTAMRTASRVQSEALKALQSLSSRPTATDAQKAAFRVALTKFLEARKAIRTTFNAAVTNAQRVFKGARESATTKSGRLAARQAFLAASKVARRNYQAALKALGNPPVKPAANSDSR